MDFEEQSGSVGGGKRGHLHFPLLPRFGARMHLNFVLLIRVMGLGPIIMGFVLLLDWAYGRVQVYKYSDESMPSGFLEINIMPLFRSPNCHRFH